MAAVSKETKEEGEREEEDTGEKNKGDVDVTEVDNYGESKSHLRSISNQVLSTMESVIDSESDSVLENIGKLLSLLKEYGVYQVQCTCTSCLLLFISFSSSLFITITVLYVYILKVTEDKDDGQFRKLQLLTNIITMNTSIK